MTAWPYGRSVRSRCRPIWTSKYRPRPTQAGLTYSGWLAATTRKEFILQSGLKAVAEFEREHGVFTAEELAEAERWVDDTTKRAKRSGGRQRKSA